MKAKAILSYCLLSCSLISSAHLAVAPASYGLQLTSPEGTYSQTLSYIRAIGPSIDEALAKTESVLTAPRPELFSLPLAEQAKKRKDPSYFIKINTKKCKSLVAAAIKEEQKRKDYFVVYHSAQKETMLIHIFMTYLMQFEHEWRRDDFFVFRFLDDFYKKNAPTALDYIKQNIEPYGQKGTDRWGNQYKGYITQQFITYDGVPSVGQFDMNTPMRSQLMSTGPGFVCGVDDTDMELRHMTDQDYPAWESPFYYFATNLSWSSFDRLFNIIISNLKQYCPELFEDRPISKITRKLLALRFSGLPNLLRPLANEKKEVDAGIAYQIFIPKDIIDNVAYLSWMNGCLWQRKIGDIEEGWDKSLGAYTKVSEILKILQEDPLRLGRSINLIQVRLIFKDRKYFFDPTSPIRMNLITNLRPSLMRSLKDVLQSLAIIAFGFKRALKRNNLEDWAETTNLDNDAKRFTDKIKRYLASKKKNLKLAGLEALKFLVAMNVDLNFVRTTAEAFRNDPDEEIHKLSEGLISMIQGLKSGHKKPFTPIKKDSTPPSRGGYYRKTTPTPSKPTKFSLNGKLKKDQERINHFYKSFGK